MAVLVSRAVLELGFEVRAEAALEAEDTWEVGIETGMGRGRGIVLGWGDDVGGIEEGVLLEGTKLIGRALGGWEELGPEGADDGTPDILEGEAWGVPEGMY